MDWALWKVRCGSVFRYFRVHIPHALYQSRYSLQSFAKFLFKRIVRVDPPYLASVITALLLPWFSTLIPGFRGTSPPFEPLHWLAHLAYLNVYFNYPWLNEVYWTLAIEFQFYLLIGLTIPLIVAEKRSVRLVSLVVLLCFLYVIRSPVHITGYIHYFALGIVLFQSRAKLLSRSMWWSISACLLIWALKSEGVAGAVAAGLTVVVICMEPASVPVLEWLGAISYTLYLFDYPILRRVIHLGLRFGESELWRFGLLLGATAVTLFVSRLLYLAIEKPSQEFASAIRY